MKYFEVAKSDIAYLKFILEGYPGLALMKTLDAKEGQVVMYIAPGAEEEAAEVIALLLREISSLKPIERRE